MDRKTATIAFQNPKKDSTLYLEYDARTDLFNPPQQVTIRIGDQAIGTLRGRRQGAKLVTFPMTRRAARSRRHDGLVIEVDRTFEPGGGDPRELGIRVFHAFIEPVGRRGMPDVRPSYTAAAIRKSSTVAILDRAAARC